MSREVLLIVRFDVEPAQEDAWNEWYTQVHLPEALAVPGVLEASGRRFVKAEGGGPRYFGPKYMTLYRLADPNVVQSEPWLQMRGLGKFEGHLYNMTRNVYVEIT